MRSRLCLSDGACLLLMGLGTRRQISKAIGRMILFALIVASSCWLMSCGHLGGGSRQSTQHDFSDVVGTKIDGKEVTQKDVRIVFDGWCMNGWELRDARAYEVAESGLRLAKALSKKRSNSREAIALCVELSGDVVSGFIENESHVGKVIEANKLLLPWALATQSDRSRRVSELLEGIADMHPYCAPAVLEALRAGGLAAYRVSRTVEQREQEEVRRLSAEREEEEADRRLRSQYGIPNGVERIPLECVKVYVAENPDTGWRHELEEARTDFVAWGRENSLDKARVDVAVWLVDTSGKWASRVHFVVPGVEINYCVATRVAFNEWEEDYVTEWFWECYFECMPESGGQKFKVAHLRRALVLGNPLHFESKWSWSWMYTYDVRFDENNPDGYFVRIPANERGQFVKSVVGPRGMLGLQIYLTE